MNRREFLKLSSAGVATIMVGNRLSWLGVPNAFAADSTVIDVVITDARKQMVTYNEINQGALSYFWIYKMSVTNETTATTTEIPPDCPGPTICCVNGDTITFNVTNNLDEPHCLAIPDLGVTTGLIAPGLTAQVTVTASQSGAFLYYDNLNEPVNRMMGLHGALVVRPAAPSGANYTPYDDTTQAPHVQALYDAFGTEVFPGLRWEDGDPNTGVNPTPPFRQYIWLTHEVSPRLFAEVGNWPAGQDYPAGDFLQKFLRDPFSPTRNNNNPEYFTVNGQSGVFSHASPTITPTNRVGEPVVIHILNAGLWTHAMHLHANHFYITCVNGEVSANPLWVDVYNVYPMDRVDYTVPFMRPPDVPNIRGIGLPDPPLVSPITGQPVWPPVQEMDMHIPAVGTISLTGVPLEQRLSPLCYPMHDHSEPSQSAQGGNYNMGMISGMYIIGDRNTMRDFPMEPDFTMMFRNVRGISETGPAPGPEPNPPGPPPLSQINPNKTVPSWLNLLLE